MKVDKKKRKYPNMGLGLDEIHKGESGLSQFCKVDFDLVI